MQISWKILEITSSKNGFTIFKLNPDDQSVLPQWAMNQAGTYMVSMWSVDWLQKWMTVTMNWEFQVNTYKPQNFFAQKQVPKLNLLFKDIEILEWLNNETGLKDFFVKEMPYVWAKLAGNIFDAYPDDKIVTILSQPEKEALKSLTDINWVWKKIAKWIYDTWLELADRREVLTELFKYGFTTSKAMKIYDTFWVDTIKKIKENPYCVIRVRGIWFKQAEELAMQHFNIPKDSLNRYIALIDFHIRELCQADTLFSIGDLKSRVKDYLLTDDFQYKETIDEIVAKWVEWNIMNWNVCKINEDIFMLSAYFNLEKQIADKLIDLKEKKNAISIDIEKVEGYDKLTPEQKQAVTTILSNKLSILTGAAGTWKTTTTKVVVEALKKSWYSYVCISPTNKAVKRIKEVNKKTLPDGTVTTIEASTIHSLLWLKRWGWKPKYDESSPMPYDYVLIDESSMMWEFNASLLLKALRPGAAIVFMWDKNQLSSVDSWSFFNDICESWVFDAMMVILSVVKRTVDDGNLWVGEIEDWVNNLVANSQRILAGKAPISTNSNTFCRFYWENDATTKKDIIDSLKKIYDKMKDKGIDYNKDYQILAPTYKWDVGIDNLNIHFSEYLNWSNKVMDLDWKSLRIWDKVYYDNKNENFGLVKWDTGYITDIKTDEKKLKIFFYDLDKECEFSFMELDYIKLGYAMSVHKSQWSEFDFASLVITSSSYSLLNNNVLYTGYTRWKKKTYLFADKMALTIALNNKESARNTYLFNILAGVPDEEIEITKSREMKWISENQIKFVETRLNDLYKKQAKLVKVKPSTSDLAGFRYIYATKEFLNENGFFDKMEITEEMYDKFKYNKDIRFVRLDNSGKEPNGFYKSKLSNFFTHLVVSFDNDKKLRLFTIKNSIKSVFND